MHCSVMCFNKLIFLDIQQDVNLRRHNDLTNDKLKRKRMRLDNDSSANTNTDGGGGSGGGSGIIEPKSEISEYGESSAVPGYCNVNVDYTTTHKVPENHTYDDAGPSSVPPSNEWLDDKHFLAAGNNTASSNASNDSQESRCKAKNFKALEPCSCPLCSRVYSNVSNLRQHMRLIHNPTSVCCPLCQKSFTSDLYLKRHYLSMHGTIPGIAGGPTPQPPPTPNQTPSQGQQTQPQQQNQTSAPPTTTNAPGRSYETCKPSELVPHIWQ